jgi:hypothetical protein
MTYYVASTEGLDSNDGQILAPFQTLAKVNTLTLQPGDEVLFRCGDTWNGEMLVITAEGSSTQPIVFGSYPERDCGDRPLLSGSSPIEGWVQHSGNIYRANLATGANAGKFPLGINQLFQNGTRKAMGRWPNIGVGRSGYSFVDGQPADDKLTDNELPAIDWTGGVIHLMGMRWYILNREITQTSGTTVTLKDEASCWGGCESGGGWGYFINNHIGTLDQDGEWHYDTAAQIVYYFSSGGAPANMEGSVILKDDDRHWGIVTLGRDLGTPISHVTLDNLEIANGFQNGISTPTNYGGTELHHVVIQNCVIRDMDDTGITLAAWVYSASDGRADGWRGGYDLRVENNEIRKANHMGMDIYSRDSQFIGNRLEQIGIIANANASGIGCGLSGTEGQCTESGDGIRVKVDEAADSGNNNLIQGNRLYQIGYNGMDVFGHSNILRQNVIEGACASKADCGGVRTYGGSSLSNTNAYDIILDQNIILEPIGNVDAANTTYNQENFAFGLYVDNYSRNVVSSNNSLVRIPSTGLLYQRSSGEITGNTIYDCSRDHGRAQVNLNNSQTRITVLSGNTLYGLGDSARTLSVYNTTTLTSSNNNRFFQPVLDAHIRAGGVNRTFNGWKTYSGMDGDSTSNWFTLGSWEAPRSEIFINDSGQETTIDLAQSYLDLNQNPVTGSLTLSPFTSQILVRSGFGLLHGISILQVLAGVPDAHLNLNRADHDLDSNGEYGMPDALGILQGVAGLR